MSKGCLVVVKKRSIAEEEKEFISELEKHVKVDIATTSEMIASQGKYTGPSSYLAIITLGGDGTILKALSVCSNKCLRSKSAFYIDKKEHILVEMACTSQNPKRTLPVFFAFDYSTKGRLCNIKKKDFTAAKTSLISYLKEYKNNPVHSTKYFSSILDRKRLTVNAGTDFLNEIYIFGAEKGFLSHFNLSVDGNTLYENIRCDGIIISTDSGSTGYNFSASGPILASGLKALVITFVCPVDKKCASIVADSSCRVEVFPYFSSEKIYAIIDGCLQIEDAFFSVECSSESVSFFSTEKAPHKQDFILSIKEDS